MGTNVYYDDEVKDEINGKSFHLEVGTTGYAGNGPQMFLNVDGASILLSHKDAKAFCEAVTSVASYFSYLK